MLTLIDSDDGTELPRCWLIWSTVAATAPTGHATCVDGSVPGADVPTGVAEPEVAVDPGDEGLLDGDEAGACAGLVDVAVEPTPTAPWLELLAGVLVRGTFI